MNIYQKVPSIPSTGNCVNWSGSGTAIIQVCDVGGQSVYNCNLLLNVPVHASINRQVVMCKV